MTALFDLLIKNVRVVRPRGDSAPRRIRRVFLSQCPSFELRSLVACLDRRFDGRQHLAKACVISGVGMEASIGDEFLPRGSQ